MKKILSNMGLAEKIALGFFILTILVAIFGPMLAPFPPEEIHLLDKHLPPAFLGGKSEYLLGTDELGRDLLSRILQATRVSMTMALIGGSRKCSRYFIRLNCWLLRRLVG